MIILKDNEEQDLRTAADLLKKGYLVAFPTETVFGVGCIYDNITALDNLNILKKRASNKAYTIMLSKTKDISKFAFIKNKKIKKFLHNIFPGPLTVVLPARKNIFNYLVMNGNIGIRIPKCECILKIINILNKPILAPSLNISNEKPMNNIDDIKKKFSNQIKAIVLPSKPMSNISSTVFTFNNNDKIEILRSGEISLEHLKRIYNSLE